MSRPRVAYRGKTRVKHLRKKNIKEVDQIASVVPLYCIITVTKLED